jgi:FKBP-type peptidyl-prolyl cis-trans isomerase
MKYLLLLCFCLLSLSFTYAQSDTVYTTNGIRYVRKKAGDGITPKEGQKLKVRYTGKFLNGEVFESVADKDFFSFKIGDPTIIKGWSEGFILMSTGEKGVFVIPPFMAYGAKGVKDPYGEKEYMIPPNATLIYEVELISFK